jgi:hypothetical protein
MSEEKPILSQLEKLRQSFNRDFSVIDDHLIALRELLLKVEGRENLQKIFNDCEKNYNEAKEEAQKILLGGLAEISEKSEKSESKDEAVAKDKAAAEEKHKQQKKEQWRWKFQLNACNSFFKNGVPVEDIKRIPFLVSIQNSIVDLLKTTIKALGPYKKRAEKLKGLSKTQGLKLIQTKLLSRQLELAEEQKTLKELQKKLKAKPSVPLLELEGVDWDAEKLVARLKNLILQYKTLGVTVESVFENGEVKTLDQLSDKPAPFKSLKYSFPSGAYFTIEREVPGEKRDICKLVHWENANLMDQQSLIDSMLLELEGMGYQRVNVTSVINYLNEEKTLNIREEAIRKKKSFWLNVLVHLSRSSRLSLVKEGRVLQGTTLEKALPKPFRKIFAEMKKKPFVLTVIPRPSI